MAQDWLDIDFAIRQQVDFIAVSFVKSADVIKNLKSYLNSRADKVIEVIAKVESHDSVPNIEEIVEASDAVMVARGDLGEHQTATHNRNASVIHVKYLQTSAVAWWTCIAQEGGSSLC